MNDDLACNLVQDLLPIHIDGIASEETNIYVEEHLAKCESCSKEYKKLCKIPKNKEYTAVEEVSLIKTLKKRIVVAFVTVIIASVLLISLNIFCSYSESPYHLPKISELLVVILLYIGIYFLPLLGILVSVIWKKTLNKKSSAFWPNTIIAFLSISVSFEIIILLWHFVNVIKVH